MLNGWSVQAAPKTKLVIVVTDGDHTPVLAAKVVIQPIGAVAAWPKGRDKIELMRIGMAVLR